MSTPKAVKKKTTKTTKKIVENIETTGKEVRTLMQQYAITTGRFRDKRIIYCNHPELVPARVMAQIGAAMRDGLV